MFVNVDTLLRVAYRAFEEGVQIIGPTYLSLHLGIPKSSAQNQLIRLAETGLGVYVPKKGFLFNEKGLHEAKKAVKKHRLLECLMEELGMERGDACREAARIEAVVGEGLIRLLEDRYRPRRVCPCGKEIPEVEG
ncbi:metal-dependent transcriptional regulator [Archaeoglobus veneficus]|uniref:Iron (Metal) dependent repressor, DtxR family n=1 Tax=Archaeoglobus veneficus (strain DSM 11195 / SNP6) TaxID=693661 RepID=F2KMY4_ARCVS|nr:metal-dependent transcriptional regulator [Archaeoglobus veneficus]AEA47260.1 iron (metal) dependent repressor, DtxR family [Archaeoglobus veneficus SNP6]